MVNINSINFCWISIIGYTSLTFWKGKLSQNPVLRKSDVCSGKGWHWNILEKTGIGVYKSVEGSWESITNYCPACRTYEITTRFWVVVICPIIKCLIVLEFSFILFDLCLFITIFNFILNYVLIVTFWIFTYHKVWILLIIYCFIWNYWIIYFLISLEVFWSVVN